NAGRTGHPLVSGLRLFKTYDGESFKAHEFCGKVHRVSQIQFDHLGAFMGYGDYVMGDSLPSESILALYTISIDDMMKSSPICLLSKASKSKSWLWHRRLNLISA
ncbi:hypothetical protein Tco_0406502, partial [Tanacetum coccineum]